MASFIWEGSKIREKNMSLISVAGGREVSRPEEGWSDSVRRQHGHKQDPLDDVIRVATVRLTKVSPGNLLEGFCASHSFCCVYQ